MNMWKKLAVLAALVVLAKGAEAAVSDALTITITPNAGYAVDIDTTGVVLDFPSANLNVPAFVVSPATVTIESTYATTELELDASLTGGWTLGSSTTTDVLQAWALFTSTTVSTIPSKSGNNFDDTNDRIASGAQQVGDTSAFEDGTFNTDDMAKNQKSHLWIRFHTPDATSVTAQQALKLTLTAQAPN
jgi:archaellin